MPISEFYLAAVDLSTGSRLSFKPGDIVLLVGPNNSGKSTFLREAKGYLEDSSKTRKLLSKLDYAIHTSETIPTLVKRVFKLGHLGANTWYAIDNAGSRQFYIDFDEISKSNFKLGEAANALAISLDAETRLSLSNPTDTIDITYGLPRHPFHHFMLDRKKLRAFARVIQRAFGFDFTITRIGNPIRGYVGRRFENDQDSLESDQQIPAKGERMELQGDGIRSYAGIAAEIFGYPYPITLLDEPEAFLHPPQAKMLGRLFVSSLPENCQAFIATHSSDFLQGVLHSRSPRARVLRLDRSTGALQLMDLDNAKLQAAVAHPSIANSNLLDALFFSQTVICEADADCSLFDWIVREFGSEPDREPDRFWFSSGGKHQTPKIAQLLTAFGVDFRVILDLDALGDWSLLERLCSFKGLDIGVYKKRIDSALSVLQRPSVGAITAEIQKLVQGVELSEEETERGLLKKVQRSIDKARRSHPLKQYGLSAFRHGQERSDVEAFLGLLSAHGIVLLRKGEIESYVPEIGLHGPGWAAAVLDNYEDHKTALQELLGHFRDGIT